MSTWSAITDETGSNSTTINNDTLWSTDSDTVDEGAVSDSADPDDSGEDDSADSADEDSDNDSEQTNPVDETTEAAVIPTPGKVLTDIRVVLKTIDGYEAVWEDAYLDETSPKSIDLKKKVGKWMLESCWAVSGEVCQIVYMKFSKGSIAVDARIETQSTLSMIRFTPILIWTSFKYGFGTEYVPPPVFVDIRVLITAVKGVEANWADALGNKTSHDYIDLRALISNWILATYKELVGGECKILRVKFSKGSIVADIRIGMPKMEHMLSLEHFRKFLLANAPKHGLDVEPNMLMVPAGRSEEVEFPQKVLDTPCRHCPSNSTSSSQTTTQAGKTTAPTTTKASVTTTMGNVNDTDYDSEVDDSFTDGVNNASSISDRTSTTTTPAISITTTTISSTTTTISSTTTQAEDDDGAAQARSRASVKSGLRLLVAVLALVRMIYI